LFAVAEAYPPEANQNYCPELRGADQLEDRPRRLRAAYYNDSVLVLQHRSIIPTVLLAGMFNF